jgi:large subunit ribosomal protein L9
VNNGYGRNYLVPHGLAMDATDDNVKRLEGEKRSYDSRQGKMKEKALEIADAISKVQLTIPMRASAEGHLFGSVTPHTIIDAFHRENIELKASMVELDNDHIRELGTYSFKIRLHEEVEVASRAWVVAAKE